MAYSLSKEVSELFHWLIGYLPAREESVLNDLHAKVDELTEKTEPAEPTDPTDPADQHEDDDHKDGQ